jgi:hypothetical protein
MTVALSILFAAAVGGVVFALIDRVGRQESEPEVWMPPEAPTRPLEPPPAPEATRDGLWAGWARD